MLQFFKGKHKKEQFFLEHGSKLLEGIASASNYKYDVPYRSFTAKELISATNNFRYRVIINGRGYLFRGSFQQRPILVKRSRDDPWLPDKYIYNDMVISLMMSHHKNVLKFLGCCLDVENPAVVYECTGNVELLDDILYTDKEPIPKKGGRSLSWTTRLKVATDVGNALAYLHTAFATPIIHRYFNTRNIIIDQFGVASLLDFSLCIALPPGETQVEENGIFCTAGYVDPEYVTTGIITEKTDVYAFGIFLLTLLTGKKWFLYDAEFSDLADYVKDCMDKNCLNKALDSLTLEEKGDATEQQMHGFAEVAMKCSQPRGEDRPNMIDVARELSRIERSSRSCCYQAQLEDAAQGPAQGPAQAKVQDPAQQEEQLLEESSSARGAVT